MLRYLTTPSFYARRYFASSAKEIKKLREISGSTIAECKSAIEDANGNIEKALEFLKDKGMARADKTMKK